MSSSDVHPVHIAVMRHSLHDLSEALSQGADVDALDRTGRTALFYAAKDGELELANELIRYGANVEARDKGLKTPLHFAAAAYQPAIAELLVRNGAGIDAQDVHGNTPMSDAVFNSKGRGEMIKLLLALGADKELKNKHGVSPDGLAKSIGNYDVARFLA